MSHFSRSRCTTALFTGLGLTAGILSSSAFAADSVSGQIDVSLTITPGCYITDGSGGTGSTDDDGNLQLGSLDFGSAPPVWSTSLTSEVQSENGTGAIEVTCNEDYDGPISVTIDGGLNEDGGQRYLTTGAGTTEVAYDLYNQDDQTVPYTPNEAVDVPLSDGSASVNIPVYGYISQNPTDPKAAGDYTDTLTMTLAF